MPRQCEKGFIQAHLDFTRNQQSPSCFHIWTAIGIISAVLGRKVWMPSSGSATEPGYYDIYPNLYTVLVSPSGVGMKGTALSQGIDLLDASGVPVDILRGKISATRLITRLAAGSLLNSNGDAELLVFSREFKVFTKGVMQDSSLIEDLTDLYDNQIFDYETEHSVRQQIKRPCVGIIAASTPEWLSGGSANDLMSGGFGARTLPISVIKDEREIAWATKTKLEKGYEEKLIEDLKQIGELKGRYYVTTAAKEFFQEWYVNRKALRTQLDSRLDGYYAKKHEQMRKLAIVLAASFSNEMVVDLPHMEMAKYLLEENEKNILFAYSGAAAATEVKYRDQIIARIKDKGEITHTELAQYFYHGLGRKGLREVIYGLIEEGVVEAEQRKTKTKPIIIYKWKEGEKESD